MSSAEVAARFDLRRVEAEEGTGEVATTSLEGPEAEERLGRGGGLDSRKRLRKREETKTKMRTNAFTFSGRPNLSGFARSLDAGIGVVQFVDLELLFVARVSDVNIVCSKMGSAEKMVIGL